jgi:hypothetical protein
MFSILFYLYLAITPFLPLWMNLKNKMITRQSESFLKKIK